MSQPARCRPLTDEEAKPDERKPLRVYPFQCKCGSQLFNLDWAMYNDLQGEARIWCVNCNARVVPTEPMEFNA